MEKLEKLMEDLSKKMDNVATKDDLNFYKNELVRVEANTESIKTIVMEVQRDREYDKKRMEWIEKSFRSKNLIFKGVIINGRQSVVDVIADVINHKMSVTPNIIPEQIRFIGKVGESTTVLVQFHREDEVRRVLEKTNLLAGSNIFIDRDLTLDERKSKAELMKVRRVIISKLSDQDDKKKKVKVTHNSIRIEGHIFKWNGEQLLCGKESGNFKLSQIFKFRFENINFKQLISEKQ